jgi:hypothetical protein
MNSFQLKPVMKIACLMVGLIRPLLLFVALNPHVQNSYEAASHLLLGALIAMWAQWAPFRVTPWLIVDRLLAGWTIINEGSAIRYASVLVWIEIGCSAITFALKFA